MSTLLNIDPTEGHRLEGDGENPFALSIGDLMAALLLVFILALTAALLLIKEHEEASITLAEEYEALHDSLYKDLMIEFRDDLDDWDAEIDSLTLAIRFREPEVLFERGESRVKERFVQILDDFFPRYIEVLRRPRYRNELVEIRIEGHTSSEWSVEANEETAYFENMRLSQDRTRSVLQHCLSTLMSDSVWGWTRNLITANGLSSSQPILNVDGTENLRRSRRVEFRVRTDAEAQLSAILDQVALSRP